MSYKIWISCDKNGVSGVGAKIKNQWKAEGVLADAEQVYGSQIKYRCTFRRSNGTMAIMTPTAAWAAQERGEGKFCYYFPQKAPRR